MIFVNGDLALHFHGQMIRYFLARHDTINAVKIVLKLV